MLHTFALPLLDWAIISLSLFNLIALLWLGLTVLLNAERRTLGTWIAGGGLILCGLFFVGHTAVVGRTIGTFDLEMGFWWRASWVLTVGAPYLWYLGTAAYTGVLQTRRHRLLLAGITILGAIALVLLYRYPLPSINDVAYRAPITLPSVAGLPLAAIGYPFYSVLCFGLALLAFYHPEASGRFMGDWARQRARPWLVASTLALSAIGLAFGAVMAWFLKRVQEQPAALYFLRRLPLFMAFDLLLLMLVTVAVVLTGQAIVSYEIFTGKTLPRHGLRRNWRRCLVLAAGFGAIVGLSLIVPLSAIYRVLIATGLMTVFYALLSWRSYAEREQSVDQLRPFVRSQRLYDRLLTSHTPNDLNIAVPFQALCSNVLDAERAYLVALGPLAPLVDTPLTYAVQGTASAPPPTALAELWSRLHSPQTMYVPVDPHAYNGAGWAVPLWSERGLIGVLLLGPKRDGGLYSQEDIEIARATGERLIDTQASAELARRLMVLQRQRLAESQVIDSRARRVLHDDVLPRLHAAMLMLGSNEAPDEAEVMALLTETHQDVANLLYAMPMLTTPEVTQLGLVGALRHALNGELKNAFDTVRWQIMPEAQQLADAVPAHAAEVLVYAAREAIRNAARYGRHGAPTRSLHLNLSIISHDGLEIVIEDDGVGLGAVQTGSHGGAGQGLALHSTMLAVIGGTLLAERVPAGGTRVTLTLPQAMCTGTALVA